MSAAPVTRAGDEARRVMGPAAAPLLDGPCTLEKAAPPRFQSASRALACLMSVSLGAGSVLRFPRTLAIHGQEGGLAFLVAWLLCMLLWSLPLVLAELAFGRYTHRAPLEGFRRLLGPRSRWGGVWQALISVLVGAVTSVTVGFCLFYLANPLPVGGSGGGAQDCGQGPRVALQGMDVWHSFHDSQLPVATQAGVIVVAIAGLLGGLRSIRVVAPLLLLTSAALLMGAFVYGVSLPGAADGLQVLFRCPEAAVWGRASLWRDALVQASWDTGAGLGLLFTYASFMPRSGPGSAIVKIGVTGWALQGIVAALSGAVVFAAAFSRTTPGVGCTGEQILALLGDPEASYGITLHWVPLMYSDDRGGGALTTVYFLTLLLSGLASLLAVLELLVHSLVDVKCRRPVAAALAAAAVFAVGLPSALYLDVLVNQEFCWGASVLVSGALLARTVAAVGVEDFRQELINNEGVDSSDLVLPRVWSHVIRFVSPALSVAALVWWAAATIDLREPWFQLGRLGSLGTSLAQWAGLAVLATAISTLANRTWCARQYKRRGPRPTPGAAVTSLAMTDSPPSPASPASYGSFGTSQAASPISPAPPTPSPGSSGPGTPLGDRGPQPSLDQVSVDISNYFSSQAF